MERKYPGYLIAVGMSNLQNKQPEGEGTSGAVKPTGSLTSGTMFESTGLMNNNDAKKTGIKRPLSATDNESNAAKKKKENGQESSDLEEADSMETDTVTIKKELLQLEFQKLHDKLDKVVGGQDKKIDDMKSEIDELREEIAVLRKEMDQVQLATRKNKLMFLGVREDMDEQPERTFQKVKNIIGLDLGQASEIDTVQRVGRLGENSHGKY